MIASTHPAGPTRTATGSATGTRTPTATAWRTRASSRSGRTRGGGTATATASSTSARIPTTTACGRSPTSGPALAGRRGQRRRRDARRPRGRRRRRPRQPLGAAPRHQPGGRGHGRRRDARRAGGRRRGRPRPTARSSRAARTRWTPTRTTTGSSTAPRPCRPADAPVLPGAPGLHRLPGGQRLERAGRHAPAGRGRQRHAHRVDRGDAVVPHGLRVVRRVRDPVPGRGRHDAAAGRDVRLRRRVGPRAVPDPRRAADRGRLGPPPAGRRPRHLPPLRAVRRPPDRRRRLAGRLRRPSGTSGRTPCGRTAGRAPTPRASRSCPASSATTRSPRARSCMRCGSRPRRRAARTSTRRATTRRRRPAPRCRRWASACASGRRGPRRASRRRRA